MTAITAMGLVAGATQAQAACWNEAAYQAAQIRNFETQAMVTMLRCRIKGTDFTESYNQFIRAHRPVLDEANGRLRGQFALSVGPGAALDAYDRYMTKVANSFGGGGSWDCDKARLLLETAAIAPASFGLLAQMADRAGVTPSLPESRCPVSVAMNVP